MSLSHPQMLHDDVASVARAAEVLRAGGLLGLPTETVYGLAADARNAEAVARIFEAKGRPRFNPLIVHVPDLVAVGEIAVLTEGARVLAEAFWPGALTLVLPSRGVVADLVSGGLDTLAVRVPAHPVARAVLEAF
ncbi:translation factor Sua5, partial [Rhodobacterales bacterium HKCCE4037]|nr:translation factor Sua5 [Rhodobacterales bacterium HKCCE4037]